MDKEIVSRIVGNCLVERKLKDFDQEIEKYGEFIQVSQSVSPQPTHVSEIAGELTNETDLRIAKILYGIDTAGALTWLGEIIDSSD